MAKGSAQFFKCVLFVANLIILVCGIAIIAVGVWALLDRQVLPAMYSRKTLNIAIYIIIATGVFITFVSFLGCCGAMKESKFMLILFFLVLFLILILLVAAAIVAYVSRDRLETNIRYELKESITKYGVDKTITVAWDMAQKKLQCCGIAEGKNNSFTIWAGNDYLKEQEMIVPLSCCRNDTSPQELDECQSDPETHAYKGDCVHKLKDLIRDSALIVGGIGIAVACVLVIGMMLSCGLYQKIGREEERLNSARME